MGLHKDVAEDNMHEPKNMTTLTGGATDIGKVLVSLGTGASETRKLLLSDMDSSDVAYGQLNISGNSTVIAVPLAVDTTLATNTDYIQVVGIWDAIPHGLNNAVTQQTNSFTTTIKGDYEIHIWADTATSVNSTTIAVKFAVNGVIGLVRRPKNFMRNVGEFHNLSAHGFVSLDVGDIVTLFIASDKASNITIEDSVLSLRLLRRT